MGNRAIVFIDSEMTGVNTLTGQVGSLTALLYQALVTGGPSVAIDSITRSGAVATASKNNHGFQMVTADVGQWVVIAGADQADYNGMKQLTSVTANSFTFAVSGSPVTPATGTITAKFAPLGWSRPYSGTNKAVFQGDEFSDGLKYRFDDSGGLTIGARGCTVRGYETMTDVDTGSNAVPTVVQAAANLVVKSDALDATARQWFIVGDGQSCYLGLRFKVSSTSPACWYEFNAFGDCLSETAGDSFRGILSCNNTDSASSYNQYPNYNNTFINSVVLTATQAGKYKTRGYNQTPGAIPFGTMLHPGFHNYLGSAGMAYPNAANNGFHLAPLLMTDGARVISRLPGMYDLWHDISGISHRTQLADVPALAGRKLIFLKTSMYTTTLLGAAVDLTGPWRS